MESNLTAADPVTQEIKKNLHLPYPNFFGRAFHRRRSRLRYGWNRRCLRRHLARSIVEDQYWFRLLGAASDIRGQQDQYVAIASDTDPASGKRRRANAPELNQ
jgi:hypothetical protein